MTPSTSSRAATTTLPRIRRRHDYFLWVVTGLVVLVVVGLSQSLATNKNMQWGMVGQYMFDKQVLSGVLVTLVLTVICLVLSIILGTILAIMRMSRSWVLSAVSAAWVWFFRGVPLLVQVVFWYNLAALFPAIGLGIPATEVSIYWDTNKVISGFTAALLAFTFHEAAYMAEIVRSGILSVPPGQREAAVSSGMTEGMALRRIILPQAMRVIIPPTGNLGMGLLKATSLVAFISGGDLLTMVQSIYAVNFAVIPLLLVATIWYLAIVSVASVGQYFLERRMGRGFTVFNTVEST